MSGSGLTQKIIEIKFLNIPIFPLIYLLILYRYLFSINKKPENSILFLFLAFLVFVNFHPQWLLWFLPFIISPLIKNKLYFVLFVIIIIAALSYILLINDRYLVWGHFIPINPYFIQLNHPYLIISQKTNLIPENLQNYLKYFIALLSLLFLIPTHEKIS